METCVLQANFNKFMKKYSKKWMESFLESKLPNDKIILDTMSRKAFEVESIEEVMDESGKLSDSLFEIKVLPNRVADAMSLSGMAKELSALFDIKYKDLDFKKMANLEQYDMNNDFIDIREKEELEVKKGVTLRAHKPVLCFSGLKVKFDNSQETPEWIKDVLIKSGGRSINLLVDLTNLLLFSYGQPAHVFDFDKLQGKGDKKIITRFAEDGEELELLDGKKVKLISTDYLICDEQRGLSLAGIKGGRLAEVDKNTKIGIFEMANFNPTMIRKTSQRLGLRTDASKIFENGISTTVTQNALAILVATINELQPTAEIEFIFQENLVTKRGYKVGLSLENINNYAGKKFTIEEIEVLLKKQDFQTESVVVGRKMEEVVKNIQEINSIDKIEYKMGASVSGGAPKFFDCSSLVSYIFKESGVQIPRTTIDQFLFGDVVHETELHYGDLVFMNSGEGEIWKESIEYKAGTKFEHGMDHVGMFIGDGKILHISRGDDGIQIEDLYQPKIFLKEKIVGYKRMCDINKNLTIITPPDQRLDIKIEVDVIEEILRLYGFDNLESRAIVLKEKASHDKIFLLENFLKLKLFNIGFTEIFNYTFVDNGNVKVKLGLASDKEYLRNNLSQGAKNSFAKNYNYMPILEIDILKYFEIGTVFLDENTEEKRCVIVCDDNKKKTKYLESLKLILKEIEVELEIPEIEIISESDKPAMIEFSLFKMVSNITKIIDFEIITKKLQSIVYKPISVFPFIVRDVAVWMPHQKSPHTTLSGKLCQEILELKLENVEKIYVFDSFTKKDEFGEDKTSVAFRIIFQSHTMTLTDEKVEKEMTKVSEYLKNNGYEIR